MNKQEYLTALSKSLAGMDRAARDTVLREIESHIAEAGQTAAQDLEQRFGTPEALAQQYLEDFPEKPAIAATVGRFGRRILMVLGGSVLVLALLIAGLVYWFSGDAFNFADEQAAELVDPNRLWQTTAVEQPPAFHLDQARSVFYWHDQPEIRWSCKGSSTPEQDGRGVYQIRHQDCLIYLPKQPVTLITVQADVVLIHPKADVNLDLRQSKARIAANDSTYRYQITQQSSQVEGLQDNAAAAISLTIYAFESKVVPYQY